MRNTNEATNLDNPHSKSVSSEPREYIRQLRYLDDKSFERQWSARLVKRFLIECRRLSGAELRRIRFLERSFLVVISEFSRDDPMRDATVLNISRFLSHPLFDKENAARNFFGTTFLKTVREFDPEWSPIVKKAWKQTLEEIFVEIDCAQRKLSDSPWRLMMWPRREIMEQAMMAEALAPTASVREISLQHCDSVA